MILYQYRKIDQYTIKTLVDNEFYFSFPKEFNDPFDCLGYTTCPQNKNNIEAFLNSMKDSGRMSIEQINETKEMFEKVNYDPVIVNKFFPSEPDNIFRNKMIVKCFTAKNDSILMWSHYAQHHNGLCLGFEVTQSSIEPRKYFLELDKIINYNNKAIKFMPIDKVNYPMSDDILEFNPFESVSQVNFLTTKHKDWCYEQEFRIVLPYDSVNTRIINFKKEILREVNFGLNTNKQDVNMIKEIVNSNYTAVKFKKAKRVIGKYKIEFEII